MTIWYLIMCNKCFYHVLMPDFVGKSSILLLLYNWFAGRQGHKISWTTSKKTTISLLHPVLDHVGTELHDCILPTPSVPSLSVGHAWPAVLQGAESGRGSPGLAKGCDFSGPLRDTLVSRPWVGILIQSFSVTVTTEIVTNCKTCTVLYCTRWQFNRIFWPPKSWPKSSPNSSPT